jgi:hypothetical protein
MPPAALSSSNAPSIEYRRHHRVEAPAVDQREYRPGWRVKTGRDGRRGAGAISPRQYRIALAFRAAYEQAMKGAVRVGSWGAVYVDSGCHGSPAAEISERQADALDLVRRASRLPSARSMSCSSGLSSRILPGASSPTGSPSTRARPKPGARLRSQAWPRCKGVRSRLW